MTASERINIIEEADGITVQIRPKKVWAVVVHMMFMLVVLLVGGLLIIYHLSKREQAIGSFTTVWLFILAVFGVIYIPAFLWNLFGQEIISIRGGVFTHKLAAGEYGIKKTFQADELSTCAPRAFSMTASKNGMNAARHSLAWGIGRLSLTLSMRNSTSSASAWKKMRQRP
jgi:hypothetical protein